MTVRHYIQSDYRMINGWRIAHGGEEGNVSLPPLGVVIEDESGPLAALFCIEPAGYPAAQLESPVTRPGVSVALAKEALILAVKSIMDLAGKTWSPPGTYTAFRACTPVPIARILMRLGFVPESQEELVPLIYFRECASNTGP